MFDGVCEDNLRVLTLFCSPSIQQKEEAQVKVY